MAGRFTYDTLSILANLFVCRIVLKLLFYSLYVVNFSLFAVFVTGIEKSTAFSS